MYHNDVIRQIPVHFPESNFPNAHFPEKTQNRKKVKLYFFFLCTLKFGHHIAK